MQHVTSQLIKYFCLVTLFCYIQPVLAEGERPNFIIFILDDLGWRDVGAFGNQGVKTPNIDKLAKQGIKFNQAFLSTASCTASRASILTGLYPHQTGAKDLHGAIFPRHKLLSTYLRDAGYYTASVGKWHIGEEVREQFDEVLAGGGPSEAENWVAVLRNRPENKPFFLWFASSDPHLPFDRSLFPERHIASDIIVPPYIPDTPEVREEFAGYYDEIARADRFIGAVLYELEKQGEEENTVVFFLSDNGAPVARAKINLYDSGAKTPLIIRWPETIHASQIIESLVSAIDIAPTILSIAGLEYTQNLPGQSFLPLLKGESSTRRKYVFAQQNNHNEAINIRSVRSEEYLYIKNQFPNRPLCFGMGLRQLITLHEENRLPVEYSQCFEENFSAEELYDVQRDTYQLNNLVNNPEMQIILQKYRVALQQWQQRHGDWWDHCMDWQVPCQQEETEG